MLASAGSRSVSSSKKEYPRVEGRYRPLLLESLAQAPGGQETCLSLTSRAVSSKATEKPYTTRACPDFAGAPDGVTYDESTERHPHPGPLRDTVLGGRGSGNLRAGAHDQARARAGGAHCE